MSHLLQLSVTLNFVLFMLFVFFAVLFRRSTHYTAPKHKQHQHLTNRRENSKYVFCIYGFRMTLTVNGDYFRKQCSVFFAVRNQFLNNI